MPYSCVYVRKKKQKEKGKRKKERLHAQITGKLQNLLLSLLRLDERADACFICFSMCAIQTVGFVIRGAFNIRRIKQLLNTKQNLNVFACDAKGESVAYWKHFSSSPPHPPPS